MTLGFALHFFMALQKGLCKRILFHGYGQLYQNALQGKKLYEAEVNGSDMAVTDF